MEDFIAIGKVTNAVLWALPRGVKTSEAWCSHCLVMDGRGHGVAGQQRGLGAGTEGRGDFMMVSCAGPCRT